jgi:hypothetical protein
LGQNCKPRKIWAGAAKRNGGTGGNPAPLRASGFLPTAARPASLPASPGYAGKKSYASTARIESACRDCKNNRPEYGQVFTIEGAVDKHAPLIERLPGTGH